MIMSLVKSSPKIGLNINHVPSAIATAMLKQMICLIERPKIIFSLYSVISFGIRTSIIFSSYIALHIDLAQLPDFLIARNKTTKSPRTANNPSVKDK